MASIHARRVSGGRRYDVRYRQPDGTPVSKTFSRKSDAVSFANTVEADKLRGTYIDPRAGRVPFQDYASTWLAGQTFDRASRDIVETRLRVNAFPQLGRRQLGQIKPSVIQTWLRSLDHLAPATRTAVFAHVSAVFSAAVDDELLLKNPCSASSVRQPRRVARKLVPWPAVYVRAMAATLPARYRIVTLLGAGLGLRQGEMFGLSPEDVDLDRDEVNIVRQVKLYKSGRMAFAPPKGGKTRTVPLADVVREGLRDHLDSFDAPVITLPWGDPDNDPVTVPLVVSNDAQVVVNRNTFNRLVWRPALTAAGIELARENGCHALRHHFASVLLDGGESIKAVSEYLGHADAGFTLRTYTHLMPASGERTRRAIDSSWACAMDVRSEGG